MPEKDIQQPLNTQALQKRFFADYQKFFSKCDVVVSGDMFQRITPNISWRVGSPNIFQKLPFRAYVGIEVTGHANTVEFGDHWVYSSGKDAIRPGYLRVHSSPKVPQYLKKVFRKRYGEDNPGLVFHFFSETSEDVGMYIGTEVLILIAADLLLGKLTAADLDQMRKLKHEELHDSNNRLGVIYQKLLADAIRMDAFYSSATPSGWEYFVTIMQSDTPIVYMTEERAGSEENTFQGLPPLIIKSESDKLDKIYNWGFRLDELANIEGKFPLDVANIFTGMCRESYLPAKYVNGTVIPSFDKLRDQTKKIFRKVKTDDPKHLPSFMKQMDQDGEFFQQFARGLVFGNLKVVAEMIKVYKSRLTQSVYNSFLNLLDLVHFCDDWVLGPPPKKIIKIKNQILRLSEEHEVTVAVRNLSFGEMGGNILVFMPLRSMREEIHDFVERLQKEVNPRIHLDFASWRDGWGSEGIKVDQFLSKGLNSKFLNKADRSLKSWDEERGLSRCVVKGNIAELADYDLLLDRVNGKVYLKGQPVDSNEIPTQKATVELLSHLLDNLSKAVGNQDLSGISYAKYRNDLQGKVITPLSKLIVEKLGKPLGLQLTGGLTSFEIKWDPEELKIGLLDKF